MESFGELIGFLGGPAAIWILASVYFGSVIGERIWAMRKNPGYNNKDALCSIGLNLLSNVINLVIGILIPFAIYFTVYDNFRLLDGLPFLGDVLINRIPISARL